MVEATSDWQLWKGYDVIAVDPGVNFGMTIIDSKGVRVYNGKLKKQERSQEYAWEAFNFIKDVLSRHDESSVFVVEGAAYHKTFGQVGLADVRTGFYLGARTLLGEKSIHVVAPASARKEVFDNGHYQAGDYWPTLNHNGADSCALALWAVGARLRTKD